MLAASGVAGGPRVREILKVPSDSTKMRLLLDRWARGEASAVFRGTPRVVVAGSCGNGRMSVLASPQCALLQLSRAAVYRKPKPVSAADLELMR
jgi:hypothetical protein